MGERVLSKFEGSDQEGEEVEVALRASGGEPEDVAATDSSSDSKSRPAPASPRNPRLSVPPLSAAV